MAVLSWRARRQIIYFGVFSFIIFFIVGALILIFRRAPTCFDGIQNQEEEGVDCGGQCAPCLGQVKDITMLWSRFFEVGAGQYDFAALIENPNPSAEAPIVRYRVKFHDKNNVLIALRAGNTFFYPNERMVIFEANINTANRIPAQASIEFEPIEWKRNEIKKPDIVAFGYNTQIFPKGRLEATIRNNEIFSVQNIEVAAVLFDDSGNAIAVSKTFVGLIEGETTKQIAFTWPTALPESPSRIELFIRKIPAVSSH